jgi:hypothetical protein
MVFTPDTDTNSLAYLYAKGLIGSGNLSNWDLVFIEYFIQQCASAATLVTNSGTTQVPNGSVAVAINAANEAGKGGNVASSLFTFNPASLDALAYNYARGLIADANLAEFDLGIEQWFMEQCTLGTTLSANSGTINVPVGSMATAIAAAKLLLTSGNRNF